MQIKPGKYRTRDGRCAVVAGVDLEANESSQVIGWIGFDHETWNGLGFGLGLVLMHGT